LHHQPPQHRKIRFRRDEICKLSAMPSAEGQGAHWRGGRTRRGMVRVGLAAAAVAGCAVLLFLAAAVVVVGLGWGTGTLRSQAERALQNAVGGYAVAAIGPARIAPGAAGPLAFELEDVRLSAVGSEALIAEIGSVDFGIRLLPLLGGNLRLGSASVSDATITVAALPAIGGSDWTAPLRDGRGLVDPGLVAAAAFGPLHAAFAAVDNGMLSEIALDNITIVLPEGQRLRAVRIIDGSVSRTSADTLRIAAEADVDGRRIRLAGTAARAETGRIAALDLSISGDAPVEEVGEPPERAGRLGAFALSVSGSEGAGTAPPALKISAMVDESVLDFGARGAVTGNLRVDATLAAGTNKVEIDRLLLQMGRTSLEMNGAFGPRPPSGAVGDTPVYRYELVSSKTVVAPQDSPEPALEFMAQVEGVVDPHTRTASADRIAIRTGTGEALGTARIELAEGLAPGVTLAFSVRDMQVAHAKQLWPWFAAAGARNWALDHVFGGELEEASIQFRVLPGRLGNGVPLSAEEIVGRFAVTNTRFDTFGKVPPVRDAKGIIDVRGHDVDITMSSGTVYLPSGKTVTGRDGTLAFRSERRSIGKLDIDIEGEAGAVAELASLDPINALRVMPIEPGDLTGSVKGHVIADIPIRRGIDAKTLDWIVALDYSGLSMAKPVGGQLLTDADGKITVEPAQATVTAKGRLNGIPANFTLVEPLRPEGPKRARDVELVLDDATRGKVAPGLDSLISGTVKVRFAEQQGTRKVVADLGAARLDIPWVGWSKGAGVAATAEFSMQTGDNGVRIPDFRLSGASFSVAGEMTLSGGALSSARFDSVRLNRGDDVAVDVARSGRGYRIDIRGNALDARPVIRTLLSDTESSGKAAPRTTASVNLDVATVAGFNGESLSGVKLESDGGGLSLTAASRSGGRVTLSNRVRAGSRQVQLQAADGGAVLRFLDLYKNVQGGAMKVVLAGAGDGGMAGQVDARDFTIVNEPRLASILSTTPAGSDRSLNQAVRREIDTSRVQFERGYAQIARGDGYLRLANGVLRGPLIGATFQGTLFDQRGQMDMTGTFMPAYGLNRIFGELPLVGELLGNGRDRGLIGVTFKLDGAAKSPRLQVNPLSVMAPGIFRQIFEFN
jgi:hypothetical protein